MLVALARPRVRRRGDGRTSCRSATTGSLLSGGTVPVLSVAVGVEVTAGVTLILPEFLDQMLLRARRGLSGARRTSSRCGCCSSGLYGVITSRHLVHLVLCLRRDAGLDLRAAARDRLAHGRRGADLRRHPAEHAGRRPGRAGADAHRRRRRGDGRRGAARARPCRRTSASARSTPTRSARCAADAPCRSRRSPCSCRCWRRRVLAATSPFVAPRRLAGIVAGARRALATRGAVRGRRSAHADGGTLVDLVRRLAAARRRRGRHRLRRRPARCRRWRCSSPCSASRRS